jgi:hypothetical protein
MGWCFCAWAEPVRPKDTATTARMKRCMVVLLSKSVFSS